MSVVILAIVAEGVPIGKMAGIFLLSIIKFIAGMAIALPPLVGLDFWEIVIAVGGGSITGVIIFTYFGKIISRWLASHFKQSKPIKFSRRRTLVKIWKRFGLVGVAVLTPFISPPVSVAIALSFRSEPRKIILYISTSLFIWAIGCAIFRDTISQMAGWG